MGLNSIVVGLLEKTLVKTKSMDGLLNIIVDELKRDNMAITLEVNTGDTGLNAVNLNKIFEGGYCRNVTVLDNGGGLKLQTSLTDPFTVYSGDRIENEEISILRWQGSGAGTGLLRISGVRL